MQFKRKIQTFLQDSICELYSFYGYKQDRLASEFIVKIEYPPNSELGHYSSPCSLDLAKILKRSPREIASKFVEILEEQLKTNNYNWIEKITIAGAGFINFYIGFRLFYNLCQQGYLVQDSLVELSKEKDYCNRKIILEFISANPTGPLNIVSARAATIGDCLANILKSAGMDVYKEFYVNNVGRQVCLLGASIASRYLESQGLSFPFPDDYYQGEYIIEVMNSLIKEKKIFPLLEVSSKISFEESLVQNWLLKVALPFGTLACELLLSRQKATLSRYGVNFDSFFKESILHEDTSLDEVLQSLEQAGVLYDNEGARFFCSTNYGDEKDRVIIRSDKTPTYLLADIAYHQNKVKRGFYELINLWGPDHHGYIARLKGAMDALNPTINVSLQIFIVQQVNLMSSGKKLKMSKRLGSFSSMDDLLDEVSSDCCRYFFVARSQSSHLDFDLNVATEESDNNPVYYIQYAHARICSIFRELKINYNEGFSCKSKDFCDENIFLEFPERLELFSFLIRFCDEIDYIAQRYETHRLPTYILKLAQLFTRFYHVKGNRLKVLQQENSSFFEPLLYLTYLSGQTLKFGLELLGITVKEQM